MELLREHRQEIQQLIEAMPSGSEMVMGELCKKYKAFYPVFTIFEEVQRVLKLNQKRYKFFKNMPLTASIISRVEDFV